jgi:hypothetical protein
VGYLHRRPGDRVGWFRVNTRKQEQLPFAV